MRKAHESGIETCITVSPADLSGFASLYERTMAEKGAESFYYFPAEYWQALAGHEWLVLTDHSPQLRVANGRLDGEAATRLVEQEAAP